jgi:hypothetical protein
MAKKKRRRAGGSPPGGRREASTATVPSVRPPPPTPGGPNRQARKEMARRERERIRRRMARRRYLRIGAAVVALLAVAGGLTTYFLTRPNPAAAAGCTLRTVPPYPNGLDRAHIGQTPRVPRPPKLSTYPSVPPASGPHNPTPLASGVYTTPPNIYQAIHSLEHAAVIIWYDPSVAADPRLLRIANTFRNQDHVIVAPYDYPDQGARGRLPAGHPIVFVAWHHIESCTRISLDAARAFVKAYRVTTGSLPGFGYRGDAPEPGVAL